MTVYKVAILDVWAEAVRDQTRAVAPDDFELIFAQSYDERHQIEIAQRCDFIICGTAPISRHLIESAPGIKFVQKWGIGYDKVDLDALRDHGLGLCNTAGANSSVVAEHTILLILAVYRHLLKIDERLRKGEWLDIKVMLRNNALQLRGKTVGILGFGNIGQAVAQRLVGFETEIIYNDLKRAGKDIEDKLKAGFVDIDQLFSDSDILTVHTPLNETTHNIINSTSISKMKETAIIINCARGGVLDEKALFNSIKKGQIRGAGIDVWEPEPTEADNPLFALDQVVVTPHAAGSAFDNVGNVSNHCFQNIRFFLERKPMPPADVILPIPEQGVKYS